MKRGINTFVLCAMGSHLAVAKYLAPKMENHLFDSNDGYSVLHWEAQEGPVVRGGVPREVLWI